MVPAMDSAFLKKLAQTMGPVETDEQRRARLFSSTSKIALLAVDLQDFYCVGRGFQHASRTAHAVQDAADTLRADGVNICAVYYPAQKGAAPDPHGFRPAPQDTTIIKNSLSAFTTGYIVTPEGPDATPLAKAFRARGYQTLLICGVSTSACVAMTARDGLCEHFNVVVLKNLVSNGHNPDEFWLNLMAEKGALLMDWQDVRDEIRARRPAPNM
jgi:nicotinamidase-related amidase